MGEHMSFQGKRVDDAIASACRHFKCTREELEVEIVSGGSSGIFGLVGVKKAKINARLRKIPSVKAVAAPLPQAKKESAFKPRSANHHGTRPVAKNVGQPKPTPTPVIEPTTRKVPPVPDSAPLNAAKNVLPASQESVPHLETEATPRPKSAFSVEEAREHILKSVKVLLTNISEDGVITVDMQAAPIEVVINDEANSGLIIGRDGQTISALQYILNRIVSRKFPGIARIQLDAGNYREKQDEQLRKTALFLAQKAKASHRVQSTRPLSSYHRRVVHMALQEDSDIQTRSKGEGPMKRVLVMPRRKKNGESAH